MAAPHAGSDDGNDEREESRQFIARINQGDRTAFEELYTTLYPELRRTAIRLLGSREMAEEVVQDVFLWIWSHREQWTVRTTVRAYLYGAVRNRSATVIRAEVVQREIQDKHEEDASIGYGEPLPSPDEVTDANALQQLLLQTIRTLPIRQREALILWVRHRMGVAELGEALGVSHVAARKLLLKAQGKLQAIIDATESP
jgi:RNA polymerase sigma-70 factor, ECF subfamily